MAVLRYVLDARQEPQPQLEFDPRSKKLPRAVYEINLPPEDEGLSLFALQCKYPCPKLPDEELT
jgi:hypothetical protein